MIRLRLTCIPADLALIAGRERFSRAGFRGVPSCPVYPSPAAVSNVGSVFAGQGGRLLPTARLRRGFGGTGSCAFAGFSASSHLGLSSERRAERHCRPTGNRH